LIPAWRVNFANASFATNYPGYVNDYGYIFGDQGNGLSYGWDADNTANARERLAANSPDKRYDTLNHLQKPLPAGRVWEIEIPNGTYQVHSVGGDPSNVDSVIQNDIEGVLTSTYTPVAPAYWGEFTNIVTVEDGRLTLTSGPSASNNKIAFIEICSQCSIPVAVAIDQQPQSQTVAPNSPVALAVATTHAPYPANSFFDVNPITYQWYKGGNPVEGATADKLELAAAQLADAGNYYVVVANYAGAVTSRVATVTIQAGVELKLSNVSFAGGACSFSLPTAQGVTYAVEYKNALEEAAWKPLSTVTGNGSVQQVKDTSAAAPMRFYRVRVQ
jgi:hypothetical protein